eukprot:scaffold20276_cov224-Skeletonema_marinoi.AAC.17
MRSRSAAVDVDNTRVDTIVDGACVVQESAEEYNSSCLEIVDNCFNAATSARTTTLEIMRSTYSLLHHFTLSLV